MGVKVKREIENYLYLYDKLHSLCHVGQGDSREAMEIIEKISYLYARMAVEDIDLVDYWVTDICASTNQVLAKKLDESSGKILIIIN